MGYGRKEGSFWRIIKVAVKNCSNIKNMDEQDPIIEDSIESAEDEIATEDEDEDEGEEGADGLPDDEA